jgi:predicted RNase H-like nuclease (RuvC/YqgF family)
MASEITMETLNYRLEQLEKSVSELKSLLVDSKLQDKDIETLKTDVANLETRVDNLEKAPAETKASWFDKVVDIVFKLAITAIVGVVLTKIGFSV